ncbi:hypothetical protein PG997_006427 [Apiospora hydei]|uniref:Uncharacterized protein n=1 Tax=Apiospora hydei TaxID=1337664 RepID=A0ABR1WNS3_9PEZI
MCKNVVWTKYSCMHADRKVLERASGAFCVFESNYYAQTPCADCAEDESEFFEFEDKNEDEELKEAEDKAKLRAHLTRMVRKVKAAQSSLRRTAIMRHWYQRLDEEVEWDPVGAVDETLAHRLSDVDATLEGAARWARIIVTLPKHNFGLQDKLSLARTWVRCLHGRFPDEDLESVIYQQFCEKVDGKLTLEDFVSYDRLALESLASF